VSAIIMDKSAPASSVQRQRRTRPAPGKELGRGASDHARRQAAAVLEVLAGDWTPSQAATALGLSLPGFYHLETRALRGLVAACEPQPKRGRRRSPQSEVAALQKQNERLRLEVNRRQALTRLVQRTVGLAAPAPVKDAVKKRKRRPMVRALRAAKELQTQPASSPPAPAESG
jgi:hypothetical protein